MRTMRYVADEPRAGYYTLHEITGGSDRHHTTVGRCAAHPPWLANVLAVATVGGHGLPIARPPPTFILWFKIDADNALIEFVDIVQ